MTNRWLAVLVAVTVLVLAGVGGVGQAGDELGLNGDPVHLEALGSRLMSAIEEGDEAGVQAGLMEMIGLLPEGEQKNYQQVMLLGGYSYGYGEAEEEGHLGKVTGAGPNQPAATSCYYVMWQLPGGQRGSVEVEFWVGCNGNAYMTLEYEGRGLTFESTENRRVVGFRRDYTYRGRWLPRIVEMGSFYSNHTYAYDLVGRAWATFTGRWKSAGRVPMNRRGEMYPVWAPPGTTELMVAFPRPAHGYGPPQQREDHRRWYATCQAYYESRSWTWPAPNDSTWQNHHVQPVYWGGLNDGSNCRRLPRWMHDTYTSWWSGFRTPVHQS